MPRKPRIISSTGIYHVTLRSVNQHIIFEEDADFYKCLNFLSDCKKTYDIDIYAYCLMDNHVHLLLYSPKIESLSSFFQSFGTRFVRWYNAKYSRSGHLFQERFFSVAVESKSQYLSTLIYIHNNPIKAAICRYPSEYRWSSFNAFYGAKNSLINTSFTYNIAGSKEFLQKYFATYDSATTPTSLSSNSIYRSRHFISDEKALSIFKYITNLSATSEVANLTKVQRNKYISNLYQEGLTHKQISRLMDVSISTVKRLTKVNC